MPVTWEIRGARLRLALVGEPPLQDMEQALTEILASPLFHPGLSVLADVRLAKANPSAEDIRDRVARLAPFFVRGGFAKKCAVVTGPDPHRYAVNKSLAALGARAGIDVGVFHEIDEAIRWLAETDGAKT